MNYLRELINHTFLRSIYQTSSKQAKLEFKEVQRSHHNDEAAALLANANHVTVKFTANHIIKHIIDNIVNPPISEDEIKFAQDNHSDDKEHVYVYYTTGPELVTRAYWSYEDRASIKLLEPEPYQNDCFGKYGRHCSYGSWKHPDADQRPIYTLEDLKCDKS
jgi:hypothetical protein